MKPVVIETSPFSERSLFGTACNKQRRFLMQLLVVLILIFGLNFTTPAVNAQSAANGLKAEITAVSIPGTRRPVVTFKISDAKGKPLDLEALDPNSVKFTIA